MQWWPSVGYSDWELYSLACDLTSEPCYNRDHFLFVLRTTTASFVVGSVVFDKLDAAFKVHNGTKLVPLQQDHHHHATA